MNLSGHEPSRDAARAAVHAPAPAASKLATQPPGLPRPPHLALVQSPAPAAAAAATASASASLPTSSTSTSSWLYTSRAALAAAALAATASMHSGGSVSRRPLPAATAQGGWGWGGFNNLVGESRGGWLARGMHAGQQGAEGEARQLEPEP